MAGSRLCRLLAFAVVPIVAGVSSPGVATHASATPAPRPSSKVARPPAPPARPVAPKHGKLIFSDTFSGSSPSTVNSSQWQTQTGAYGAGNQELEYYTANAANLSQTGQGTLAITARARLTGAPKNTNRQYTSGRIVSKQAFRYGYVEARLKLPIGQGLWPAFWMLGANYSQARWPACGEIDITEQINRMTATYASLHAATAKGREYTLGKRINLPRSTGAAWHTYAINWTAGRIVWYVDGVQVLAVSKSDIPRGASWPFSQPEQIQLNLAVGGKMPGRPTAKTQLPATMLVDYVRVYAS